jgi:hypothetical protein
VAAGDRPWKRAGSSSASFGPEAMNIIGRAFDQGWAQISGNFSSDPTAIESASLSLASVLLVARRGGTLRSAEVVDPQLDFERGSETIVLLRKW